MDDASSRRAESGGARDRESRQPYYSKKFTSKSVGFLTERETPKPMARGRLISKSLGSSRKFHAVLDAAGRLGEFCQVLFPLIIVNTDDFGRMPGDAFTVKHVVLPTSKRGEREFDLALEALATVHLIERYQVDGVIYLQVNQFDPHQPNLQKRTSGKFPEFPGSSSNYRLNLTELNLTESNLTQNRSPRVSVSDEVRLRFESFWKIYPRKVGKAIAWKAWERRHPGEELTKQILATLAWQKQQEQWVRDNGRFIPHPATWINAGQWDDEPTEIPDMPTLGRQSKTLLSAVERLRDTQ